MKKPSSLSAILVTGFLSACGETSENKDATEVIFDPCKIISLVKKRGALEDSVNGLKSINLLPSDTTKEEITNLSKQIRNKTDDCLWGNLNNLTDFGKP